MAELLSDAPNADYVRLVALIADVLERENLRLVGSSFGHWEEAAPAVAAAVVAHIDGSGADR